MNKLIRFTSFVLVVVMVVLWLGYTFPKFKILAEYVRFENTICKKPVTYALRNVDQRFGITEQEVADAFDKAELVWELEASKELFQRVDTHQKHDVGVVFVYDSRQETSTKVSDIEKQISAKSSILDTEKNDFSQKEQSYLMMLTEYNTLVAEYNSLIARKNQLSTEESDQLNRIGQRIDELLVKLSEQEREIKGDVVNINKQVSDINADIGAYNELQGGNGESFREAEYVSIGNNRTIFVYEFPSKSVLSRLLSHELGHVIGLEHVAGEDSIMNEYNTSRRLTPTNEDVAELNRACNRQGAIQTLIAERLNNK